METPQQKQHGPLGRKPVSAFPFRTSFGVNPYSHRHHAYSPDLCFACGLTAQYHAFLRYRSALRSWDDPECGRDKCDVPQPVSRTPPPLISPVLTPRRPPPFLPAPTQLPLSLARRQRLDKRQRQLRPRARRSSPLPHLRLPHSGTRRPKTRPPQPPGPPPPPQPPTLSPPPPPPRALRLQVARLHLFCGKGSGVARPFRRHQCSFFAPPRVVKRGR